MERKELLDLALEINALTNKSEVKIRNAIGRLYYFIYHESLAIIKETPGLNQIYENFHRDTPSHKKLLDTFEAYADQYNSFQHGQFRKKLKSLRNLRNTSDYKLDQTIGIGYLNTIIADLEYLKSLTEVTQNKFFQQSKKKYISVQHKTPPQQSDTKSKLRIVED